MRTSRFSFFLSFLLLFFLIEQLNAQDLVCGTMPPTIAENNELLRLLGRQTGTRTYNCTDPVWTSGNRTYRLILEYSRGNTAANSMLIFAQSIQEFYGAIGIDFQITIIESPCTTCLTPNDPNWWYDLNQNGTCETNEKYGYQNHPYPECIYGRICENGFSGFAGQGSSFTHSFWSKESQVTLNHELGHALGLRHTFDQFTETDHEVVKQSSDCEHCNCLTEADLICDTHTDPLKSLFEYDPNIAAQWNNKMFDYSTNQIINLDNKTDKCGINWRDIINHKDVMSNIMSYHLSRNLITKGQENLIKTVNENKAWNITGLPFNLMAMPGGIIDTPTTFTDDKIINSDLIINSILNITNCKLYFNGGTKIVMNKGSKLRLNNAHLSSNLENGCYAVSGKWQGIKVKGRADITMRNGSIINDIHEKAIESDGHTVIIQMYSGSEIKAPFKTALDLRNGLAYVDAYNSLLYGNIFMMKTSKFNSTNCKISDGVINLSDASCYISKGSEIRNTLNINNNTIKTISIKDSKFYKGITIDNLLSTVKIVNNDFNTVQSFIKLNVVKDFGLYDNDFYNCDECLRVNGITNSAKNYIAKNKFYSGRTILSVISPSSGLTLDCNTMTNTVNKDWDIIEKIAPIQGDIVLAAGNIFSRAPIEINYAINNQLDYWYRDMSTEKPINITGSGQTLLKLLENISNGTRCSLTYPLPPEYPAHCTNGIKDGNETKIDCGGSCPRCLTDDLEIVPTFLCNNGIKDGDETGIDCGGKSCPSCTTCTDDIQNNGETGVDCGGIYCPPCNTSLCSNGLLDPGENGIDCGGPCPPCYSSPPATCYDGLKNQGETGIDCGGPCFVPCIGDPVRPGCDDGVQNGLESGVDCGGNCSPCGTTIIDYVPTCYNGIQDNGELGVDCGGSCHSCDCQPIDAASDQYFQDTKAASDAFVSSLQIVYGSSMILQNASSLNEAKDRLNYQALLDGGQSDYLVKLINTSSNTHALSILSTLAALAPMVSEKVIHSILANSHYYTQVEIANIIKKNPAVTNDRYIDWAVNQSESFTPVQIAEIRAAVLKGDKRTPIYDQMRIRGQYMHHIVQNHIIAAEQGLTPDYEVIRCQLLRKDEHEIVYQIYQTFIDEGQYNFATTYLNHLNPIEITDPYYKAELTQFKILHNMMMNHYYAGNSLAPMSNIEQSTLLTIANGCFGITSVKAAKFYTEKYGTNITASSCTGDQTLTFRSATTPRTKADQIFVVGPNPAWDELHLHTESSIEGQNYKVRIVNETSQIVFEDAMITNSFSINVSQWSSGVYTYMILEDNNVLQSSRFIKIK